MNRCRLARRRRPGIRATRVERALAHSTQERNWPRDALSSLATMNAGVAALCLSPLVVSEAFAASPLAGARITRNADGSIRTAELVQPGPARDTLEQAAWAFIESVSADFAITRDDLRLVRVHHSYAGGDVTFQQRHTGLPVIDGSLDLVLDPSNRVTMVSSRLKVFSRVVMERRAPQPSGAKSVFYVKEGVARLAYDTGAGRRGMAILIDAASGAQVEVAQRVR